MPLDCLALTTDARARAHRLIGVLLTLSGSELTADYLLEEAGPDDWRCRLSDPLLARLRSLWVDVPGSEPQEVLDELRACAAEVAEAVRQEAEGLARAAGLPEIR